MLKIGTRVNIKNDKTEKEYIIESVKISYDIYSSDNPKFSYTVDAEDIKLAEPLAETLKEKLKELNITLYEIEKLL